MSVLSSVLSLSRHELTLLCSSPAYNDARARAAALGPFSFFQSYMSQPKSQLETFKSWAGIDSDISYYLNSRRSLPPS